MLRLLFVFSLIANFTLCYHILASKTSVSSRTTNDVVLVQFSSTVGVVPDVMTEIACGDQEDVDEDMFQPCNRGSATLFAMYDGQRVTLQQQTCTIREVITYGGARYVPMMCDERIDPWTITYDIEGLLYPNGTLQIRSIRPSAS